MSKKRILIIDDDPRNIFALSANLRAKGFDCLPCSGAKEGISLMNSGEVIDMVLMDMMMPEMDGYEAIPLFKNVAGRSEVPIIAVTAQAMIGDQEKCLKAGADGYVSKPIDLDKLLQLMAKFKVVV